MSSPLAPTDEYILAAFLSGQLPDPLRQEIIAYLIRSGNARDILSMAHDAMDSLETGDGMSTSVPDAHLRGDGFPNSESVAAAALRKRIDERTLWKVTAVFAGAVLILALIVMVLVLDRPRLAGAGETWSPRVVGSDLELAWPTVVGATSYQILHFDVSTHQARVLGSTDRPRVDLATLSHSPTGQVSVLALDDTGRIVGRSLPMDLTQR